MNVRGHFVNDLAELKGEVLELGGMVEQAFTETIEAIRKKEYSKFDDIIIQDSKVNSLELEINEKATLMIAKQQPVASDLRKLIVSLKVSSDLERMGDLSVDMAKAAQRLTEKENLIQFEEELLLMASKAHVMIKAVLIAFRDTNTLEAQKIAGMDDEVDHAYAKFVQSLFEVVAVETGVTEQVMQMAFIARYIERIADYCTNIAEWIIYEVNGQRFDLN
ncbi:MULTISPECIES: phosphate signaling complex protein PhoU [Bacillaceae]|uniref:Phosphate-specific transport system accessory protein PhoU n=1 Tax=Evansella alkalicola TaxID=745819 RepID=A0ABS6JTH1_9BACI|nr:MULTISPECIES: phosphate signaling complex protein PhoU [Bacillaceae]MBU9721888.1 phosphate signaling complex protein PhoU [Bacillus alkalicola]